MADSNQSNDISSIGRLLALPNDNPLKTIVVTLAVAFICSILVSTSAVLLKPLQIANKEAERLRHVEQIISQLPRAGALSLDSGTLKVTARVVNLETGKYMLSIDPKLYDQHRAAQDPGLSVSIPEEFDIARLKRRAKFMIVYEASQDEKVKLVVIPVSGRGFGAMMYGYLGLMVKANTVVGLTFYDHRETPGIGALIDSPNWKRQWQGKYIWDEGILMLGVGPTKITPDLPEATYQVDALTGATWTGRGVTNLLHYWLGEHGFKTYLQKFN